MARRTHHPLPPRQGITESQGPRDNPGPLGGPPALAEPTPGADLSRRGFLRATTAGGLVAGAAVTGLAVASLAGCKESASNSPQDQATAARSTGGPRRTAPGRDFPAPQPQKTGQSTVVLIRHADVLDDRGRVRAKVLGTMLDEAVVALTGAKDVTAAWKDLLSPKDFLGIKTNVWKYLPTPPALENALKRRARQAGITDDRILMDDRGALRSLGSCTALINARPLRSHHWSGIGGCLKNYIMFVDKPWDYHGDSCADLGALWNLALVKGKTRLNVLDMLTPLFHGRGPHHFNPKYLWPYKGLILSRDPVAADRVGLEILRAKRRAVFGEDRAFTAHPHHVELADTRHGVGVADWKRIRLLRLGLAEDALLPT